jgi:hypothetical protein
VHETPPDIGSLPVKVTVTGFLYQPFASEAREGVAVACGAVASYLSVYDAGPTLPARSRQEPPTSAPAVSGPEYVCGVVHEPTSIPEVPSVPAKLTVSGFRYQPFASAPREGVAVVCGAVAS